MQKYLVPILLVVVAASFACQKEKGDAEEAEPKPDPTPVAKVATASIASVQMLQDCPDPEPAAPKAARGPARLKIPEPAKTAPASPAESAPASMAAPRDGVHPPPCQQSTIQVSFTGQGAQPSKVSLKGLRLLSPDGEELATMTTRLPSKWGESVYTAWDEVLSPDSDLKASYKIVPPSWSEVERKLNGSSFGVMFVLEAKIDVGGEVQTVHTQFARVQHRAIPT